MLELQVQNNWQWHSLARIDLQRWGRQTYILPTTLRLIHNNILTKQGPMDWIYRGLYGGCTAAVWMTIVIMLTVGLLLCPARRRDAGRMSTGARRHLMGREKNNILWHYVLCSLAGVCYLSHYYKGKLWCSEIKRLVSKILYHQISLLTTRSIKLWLLFKKQNTSRSGGVFNNQPELLNSQYITSLTHRRRPH